MLKLSVTALALVATLSACGATATGSTSAPVKAAGPALFGSAAKVASGAAYYPTSVRTRLQSDDCADLSAEEKAAYSAWKRGKTGADDLHSYITQLMMTGAACS